MVSSCALKKLFSGLLPLDFQKVVKSDNQPQAEIQNPGKSEWEQCKKKFNEQDYKAAESIAVSGLKKNPAHYGLYRTLGETIAKIGNAESARKCIMGSNLDSYINEKYFVNESLALVRASSAMELERFSVIYDEPSKSLPSIVTVDSQQDRREFNLDSLHSSKPAVCVLEGGKVWFDGHNLCVYDQDDVLYDSCTMGNSLLVESIRHGIKPKEISGNLGVVVARSSNNYFHWTTDVAPGFHLLDRIASSHGEIDRFLVSHARRSFQTDFMRMAGIDSELVFTQGLEHGHYFTADKLIVPVYQHRMGMGMGSWAVRYLKEIAAVNRKSEGDVRRRRIYISRRDVSSRGVDNEAQLIEFLEHYGFETVTLDGLSLEQQMAIFSQSEFVFAPHGAGLTNLLYCPHSAKVVEFFADFVQPCFRSLAFLSGLNYGHFSTIEEASDKDGLEASMTKHIIQHKNYSVDLNDVAAIFEKIGLQPTLSC